MLYPSIDKILTKVDSKYLLVHAVAIRSKQMIEYNRGCSDVLIQICAVTSSLKSIGNEILKSQLAGVLETDITDEKIQALDEAVDLFSKLNK